MSILRRSQRPRRPAASSRRWLARLAVGALLLAVPGPEARAQLAITEVMSSASTNCTGSSVQSADFCELTNFGTNTIDLTNYRFSDATPFGGASLLPSLSIAPGESVIFVRSLSGTADAAAFRQWWGEANLPTNLQIFFYPKVYGFASGGEMAQLWDASGILVDQAVFGEAQPDPGLGLTFTYDMDCGRFGEVSELGVCGVLRAASCNDFGSPGRAPCGPVSLAITQPPLSQTVDGGVDVTMSVRACGLPRPRYQWFHNGVALSGANSADLILHVVNPVHAGQYHVELTNGLERLVSPVATLAVNTNPTPARLECVPPPLCAAGGDVCAPYDLVVTPGQTATFTVQSRGYPPPAIQWSWSTDGADYTDLPGETGRTLVIPNAQAANAGMYRVRLSNQSGSTNATAALTVRPKAQLKITEAMPEDCVGTGRDWWELTNIGNEPENLCGYRWDDQPGIVTGGPTISNAVILRPGESVILLQNQTAEAFIQLWGASNLPPRLQFIGYTANGFDQFGDEINIWNPTAALDSDFIDSEGFSTATPGASFWFDTFECLDEDGVPLDMTSVVGQCGAFRAAMTCDVGSPGWTRWTPPQLTSIRRDGLAVTLAWQAQPGSTCVVQYASVLKSPPGSTLWTDLGQFSFRGAGCAATVATPGGSTQGFYRVKRTSPAPCDCPPLSP